jgi:hypothetical protein
MNSNRGSSEQSNTSRLTELLHLNIQIKHDFHVIGHESNRLNDNRSDPILIDQLLNSVANVGL